MADRDADRTRARILDAARELFVRRGYAGTSIAHIAGLLGTSKAALYYHFPSKEDILAAILAGPLSRFAELARRATAERLTPEELLGALIDLVAGSGEVLGVCANDPSVLLLLEERLRRHKIQDGLGAIVGALAGPDPTPADVIRAHGALAVVKESTVAVLAMNDGRLEPAHRAEILAAALRALTPAR